MLVDVLVAVVLVGFEAQGGHLRQHELGQPGFHQQVHAGPRARPADEFDQLVADAFGGNDGDALRHPAHGQADVGVHRDAQLGGEPGGAHHAQGIVGEGVLGGARRGQHRGVEVPDAAERVNEFKGRQAQGHRVDGEVAAQQVVSERGAKSHYGLA